MSMSYRARPVEVVAIQYTGDNDAVIEELFGLLAWDRKDEESGEGPCLMTSKNSAWVIVEPGDWIVRDPEDRLFRLDSEDFTTRFEAST